MIRNPLALAIAAGLVVIAATAGRAAARPLDGTDDALPSTDILGQWVSIENGTRLMSISTLARGIVYLDLGARGEAVGFAGDSTILATTRLRGAADSPQYGWLIVRPVGRGQLETTFALVSDPGHPSTERWQHRPDARPGTGGPAPEERRPPERAGGASEYPYVEELPEPIEKVPPVYPDAARSAHVEGTVLTQALVGADGLVKDIRIIRSIPDLDEAARTCVRLWRFKPARSHDQPVEVWVAVPVRFSLR